jgi:hypothetical protein
LGLGEDWAAAQGGGGMRWSSARQVVMAWLVRASETVGPLAYCLMCDGD